MNIGLSLLFGMPMPDISPGYVGTLTVVYGLQNTGRDVPITHPSDTTKEYLVDGVAVSGLDYTDALAAGRDCCVRFKGEA